MKKIDFITKNFNSNYFIKNLKKINSGGDFELGELVLDSAIDIKSIKKSLYYYKYYKGSFTPNLFKKFYKKYPNTFKDNDIKNFFIKNNTLNNTWSIWNRERWYENYEKKKETENKEFKYKDMITQITKTGALFYKLKDFKLIYYLGSKKKEGIDDWYNAICFYHNKNRKSYLINFYYHRSAPANDRFFLIKVFDQKPKISQIQKILKGYQNFKIFASNEIALKYALFDRDLKNSYNDIYNEKFYSLSFNNEDQFFNFYKNDKNIIENYINYNPEKFFPKINNKLKKDMSFIVNTLKNFWKENPTAKIKNHKFFKYIINPKFNWNTDKKFLESIIYSCDDIDGLLEYLPLKIQQSKEFVDEIKTLKMFRTKNKQFIVKIFKSNKDKLESLMEHYMPKTVLNDEYLMFQLLKLNKNLTLHIGDKLKKNSSFMRKIEKKIS